MTIHEETMRELCAGADWQQTYAHNARNRADELGQLIDPAEQRLADLRREAAELERELAKLRGELADVHKARDKHDRLAADFLALATRECEVNGWDMPTPAVPEQPRSAEQIRAAVDDLAEPLIDPDCRDGKCGSCVGGLCQHDCHWITPDAEKPQEAEDARPGPAPEQAETRAVRTPWALLTALYVRLLLAERGEGRHVRRRRVFKRRALVEVV